MADDDPVAVLRRWEASGATWRLRRAGPAEAVVELCTCYGEPVDELRSGEPAFLAFVAQRVADERAPVAARTLSDVLDAFAAPGAAPGGGSAAALSTALACALVERCASAAPGDHATARERAAELRAVALEVADEDAAVLAALARVLAADPVDPTSLAAALAAASEPPARLRDAATEVAALAAALQANGAPRLRGEAECARVLAEAAVRAAESVIALNQGLGAAGDGLR